MTPWVEQLQLLLQRSRARASSIVPFGRSVMNWPPWRTADTSYMYVCTIRRYITHAGSLFMALRRVVAAGKHSLASQGRAPTLNSDRSLKYSACPSFRSICEYLKPFTTHSFSHHAQPWCRDHLVGIDDAVLGSRPQIRKHSRYVVL